eukprot:5551379-Prymnesium_polylepis.1
MLEFISRSVASLQHDGTAARWTAERWLSSLAPEREVAAALLRRLRERAPDPRLEYGFLAELGSEADGLEM